MKKFDAVIIGSGLGGLQCAYILAKHGQNVCVLEKERNAGGCLQSFKRGRINFDTGFHYAGALGKGEVLNNIFNYFHLMDLPWHQMDRDGFDEILLGEKSYLIPNGYEQFSEKMSEYFPERRREIHEYAGFLKTIGEHILDPLSAQKQAGQEGSSSASASAAAFASDSLFSTNAYNYLKEKLKDELLIGVLSGNPFKIELCKESLPLYTFAQINSSFIRSAWRLKGRGSLIADSLCRQIKEMGGTVLYDCRVTELIEKEGIITEAAVAGGEHIAAERFISDIHPAATLALIKNSSAIRPVFRRRISSLHQTFGSFTVNITLKKNSLPYIDRNICCCSPEIKSPWEIASKLTPKLTNRKINSVMISFQVPDSKDITSCNALDLIAPMGFDEVSKWKNEASGKRGVEYNEFKQRKAEECISLAESCLPGLKDAVENMSCSTPLTYLDYTGTSGGSAYGIRKDCNNVLFTLLSPKTPESNLFFTGQNLNLHGILGVSITSFLTCSEILGNDAHGTPAAIEGLDTKL